MDTTLGNTNSQTCTLPQEAVKPPIDLTEESHQILKGLQMLSIYLHQRCSMTLEEITQAIGVESGTLDLFLNRAPIGGGKITLIEFITLLNLYLERLEEQIGEINRGPFPGNMSLDEVLKVISD